MIEFLIVEGETPIRIRERLKKVYGDATVDVSTVRRWVRRCTEAEGETPFAYEKRSGRPTTAVTPRNIQRVDEIIHDDRHNCSRSTILVPSVHKLWSSPVYQ